MIQMKRKRQEQERENKSEKNSNTAILSEADKGHRYGNFHNYYNFHSPSERIEWLERNGAFLKIAEKWKQGIKQNQSIQPLTYVDIGCNEGNLTMEINNKLHELGIVVHVKGFDIDPVLIQRAKDKWHTHERVVFQTLDILHQDDADIIEADLTTVFSTTMWLHIHGGDEGLERVLESLCKKTRHFLLVEPQPSKCYRNAVERLRKLGQADFDVSARRLRLRQNIEQEIQRIIISHSFRKVDLACGDTVDKTSWNRMLHLFERVHG